MGGRYKYINPVALAVRFPQTQLSTVFPKPHLTNLSSRYILQTSDIVYIQKLHDLKGGAAMIYTTVSKKTVNLTKRDQIVVLSDFSVR